MQAGGGGEQRSIRRSGVSKGRPSGLQTWRAPERRCWVCEPVAAVFQFFHRARCRVRLLRCVCVSSIPSQRPSKVFYFLRIVRGCDGVVTVVKSTWLLRFFGATTASDRNVRSVEPKVFVRKRYGRVVSLSLAFHYTRSVWEKKKSRRTPACGVVCYFFF